MTSGGRERLLPGTILRENYVVESFIGKGAYGSVYKVRHRFLGEQALKLLDREQNDSSDPNDMLSEARILAGISHPHIVRVFDADVLEEPSPATPFFTMEYLPLGTLGDLIERRIRLGIEESLEVAGQMLSGLAAAHENTPPVLHRDVTPHNVLIASTSPIGIKLSDFGLAQHVDPDTRLLKAAGTVRYQPPEADWGFATEASDLYAVALILYEMLTGAAAFPLPSDADLSTSQGVASAFSKSRRSAPAAPSTYRTGLSADVDALVLAALATDPMSRFRSAAEFRRALDSVRSSVAGDALKPPY